MITKQRKEEQTMSHRQREKLISEDTWCKTVSRNKASFSSHELLRLPRQQRLQRSHLSVHLQTFDILFQLQKTYNCLTTKRKSKPNSRLELPPLYLGIYQWGVKQFKPCTFWSTTCEKGQRSMERHWSDQCLTWLRPELPHNLAQEDASDRRSTRKYKIFLTVLNLFFFNASTSHFVTDQTSMVCRYSIY